MCSLSCSLVSREPSSQRKFDPSANRFLQQRQNANVSWRSPTEYSRLPSGHQVFRTSLLTCAIDDKESRRRKKTARERREERIWRPISLGVERERKKEGIEERNIEPPPLLPSIKKERVERRRSSERKKGKRRCTRRGGGSKIGPKFYFVASE